jgi:cytochrome c oxidase subunit 3
MNVQNANLSRTAKLEQERMLRELDLKNKRLALQLWRVVNGGVFLFFIFANYLMRQQQPVWPPAGVDRLNATLPTIISLGLLVSGWTALLAQRAIQRGDREGMLRNVLVTVALGVAFLVGLAFVWRQVPYTGGYSAIFFTMTGFHAIHVFVGMLLFAYVYRKAQQGGYSAENYWGVEATVIFWHFVDLMWILYFIVLYML